MTSPPPGSGGTHFFHQASRNQFEGMTLNSVGGNQTNDQRGWKNDQSRTTYRDNFANSGTVHGGYVGQDSRTIHGRNVEKLGTYNEYASSTSERTQPQPQIQSQETSGWTNDTLPVKSYSSTTEYTQQITYSRQRKTLQDFPQNIQHIFKELFLPAIIKFTGTRQAWTDPEMKDIEDLWRRVAPDNSMNDMKAIQDATLESLNTWRTAIGDAAVKVLKEVIQNRSPTVSEQQQISALREGGYKYRSYYFANVSYTEKGQRVVDAPFQSELISRTFSEHFKAIKNVPEQYRLEDRATGAIVLSIIAVERAFYYYSSGIPNDTEGAFSKANWDGRVVTINGEKCNLDATLFHKFFKINSKGRNPVSPQQWDQIVEAAKNFANEDNEADNGSEDGSEVDFCQFQDASSDVDFTEPK